MIYYCDYEALERPREDFKSHLIPPWLDNMKYDKIMVPLVFCAASKKGNICHLQNYNANKVPISFLRFCDSVIRFKPNEKDHTLYFHNLYYDFNIIIYELLYNDFTQYILENDNMKYTGREWLDEKVIDENKLFYVMGENLKKATGVNILYRGKLFKIRDTFRIISSSQNKILKSFGYEEKPEVDFDNLDINDEHAIFELFTRCKYDVSSLAVAIERFKDSLKEKYGTHGDTASSIALNAVKHFLGDDYNELYPSIAGEDFETVSRLAYNGGITQHSYHIKPGIIHENISYVDINSSYPNTMRGAIPYGIPEKTDHFVSNQYGEYIVYVDFKIKRPNIPCIRCSSALKVAAYYGYESETYPAREDFPLEWKGYLSLTYYDILMLQKYYDYEMKVIFGYVYQTNYALKDFVEELFAMKAHYKVIGDKVMEQAVKLILNSLYGKFAQDLTGQPEFITKFEKRKLKCTDLKKIYCPLSNCIVSHARYNLMEQINHNPLNFIYCDTDSMMVFDRTKLNQETIGEGLGQWAYEFKGANIEKCKILGKKNYMLQVDGKLHIKCVGLNQERKQYDPVAYEKDGSLVPVELNFDNFEYGTEFVIQKMQKVYGGLAMRFTTFTLRERKLMYG